MKSGVNRLRAATSTGHLECNLQLKLYLWGPSGQRAKRKNEQRMDKEPFTLESYWWRADGVYSGRILFLCSCKDFIK